MTTLGVDYSAKNLPGPGQTTIRLNLWDVAGGLFMTSPYWWTHDHKTLTCSRSPIWIVNNIGSANWAGQERYRVLSRAYLRGCQVLMGRVSMGLLTLHNLRIHLCGCFSFSQCVCCVHVSPILEQNHIVLLNFRLAKYNDLRLCIRPLLWFLMSPDLRPWNRYY